MPMKPIFAANWKMNLTAGETRAFCQRFFELAGEDLAAAADIWIAPPFLSISPLVSELVRAGYAASVKVGAQNCHWLQQGAHTGEVSADMLVEQGVSFAIVGHSERRQFYGESNEAVALRARAAIAKGLSAVVCVGESAADYSSKRTEQVVLEQLRKSLAGLTSTEAERLVIAYEPVWAIGTGLAATASIAQGVHQLIRRELELLVPGVAQKVPIIYGGSVNAGNIAEYCQETEINGALIGGASLDPSSYWSLIQSGRSAEK